MNRGRGSLGGIFGAMISKIPIGRGCEVVRIKAINPQKFRLTTLRCTELPLSFLPI